MVGNLPRRANPLTGRVDPVPDRWGPYERDRAARSRYPSPFEHLVLTVTVTDQDARELSMRSLTTTAENGRGLTIVAADGWGISHGDGAKSIWLQIGTADQPHS